MIFPSDEDSDYPATGSTRVRNYVERGVNVTTEFEDPDNLALDKSGNLYIAEDDGPGDIRVAVAGQGPQRVAKQVVCFASLSDCCAEPTGIYCDRNGQRLYVHVQHAGGPNSNDKMVAIEPIK
jgi:secreted PhoX family phosphatase